MEISKINEIIFVTISVLSSILFIFLLSIFFQNVTDINIYIKIIILTIFIFLFLLYIFLLAKIIVYLSEYLIYISNQIQKVHPMENILEEV